MYMWCRDDVVNAVYLDRPFGLHKGPVHATQCLRDLFDVLNGREASHTSTSCVALQQQRGETDTQCGNGMHNTKPESIL